jgi:hypothetical protein
LQLLLLLLLLLLRLLLLLQLLLHLLLFSQSQPQSLPSIVSAAGLPEVHGQPLSAGGRREFRCSAARVCQVDSGRLAIAAVMTAPVQAVSDTSTARA